MEDYGIDKLKAQVVRQLVGLKVAPFYGCYLRRPSDLMAPQGFAGRKTYLEDLIGLLGAEVVDFGGKSKCCGFPILTANEDNSLRMVSDHTGEAKAKGADCMVTPCPLCHLNLDGNQPNAAKKAKQPIGLPILHLPQLLGLALGFNEREMELQRHIVPAGPAIRKVKVKMLT
jgi:succinate dehydrogenase / fumarate reductase cytochrome b subunit